MLNQIIRYFDLQSNYRRTSTDPHANDGKHAAVLPQYLAVAAGVVVQPFLSKYIETGSWNVNLSDLGGRVVFGIIISAVILPGIYRASFDPQKPVLIQLMALFPLGIGWQSLFQAATESLP